MTDDNAQDTIPGIDRALANASPWDLSNISAAITARASNPGLFPIEEALEMAGIVVDQEHPNLVGAVTNSLAKAGVICGVSYTRARRASRAGGVVRLWVGADYFAATEVS